VPGGVGVRLPDSDKLGGCGVEGDEGEGEGEGGVDFLLLLTMRD
jgi:hypothetical protein